jgi:ribosomal protein L11 methyltransferase
MWALVVTVPAEEAELAADVLWGIGVRAVEERRPAGPSGDGAVELWTHVGDGDEGFARAVGAVDDRWPTRREQVDERPSEAWRDHVRPMRVDDGLLLIPAWQPPTVAEQRPGELAVLIEPGGAFGLGDHPTTVLALRALRRAVDTSERSDTSAVADVLDVGCGTGVIAIVAAILLGRRVRAVDVATAAVEATVDNAARNGVGALVDVDDSPLADVEGTYDLVVANILAPTLVELSGDLRRVTRPGGRLVISGVLDGRFDHVVAALAPMEVACVDVERGWAAVTLRHCID